MPLGESRINETTLPLSNTTKVEPELTLWLADGFKLRLFTVPMIMAPQETLISKILVTVVGLKPASHKKAERETGLKVKKVCSEPTFAWRITFGT